MNAPVENLSIPDLADPSTFVEGVPFQALARLRDKPGLYWQPAEHGTITGGFWAVTRHADIVEIEKNPEMFSSEEGMNFPSTGRRHNPDIVNHLMFKDPPDHGRLRRVVAKSFGPRIVANFEPWVREIVCEVLDKCLPKGQFDVVDEVARWVPALVIARVMGVPRNMRQQMVEWADTLFRVANDPDAPAKRMAVYKLIWAYVEQLGQEKLADPQDDMVTALAQCRERGELTESEYRYYCQLLIVAGYETTHTLIGQSLRLYAEDPAVAEQHDQAMATGNVSALTREYLRFVSPVMNMARTATQDTVFCGENIRQGDLMQMYFVSANRDASVFSDPERFDPSRKEAASVAFGGGIHRCLGAGLAELEGVVLFDELHKRGVKLLLAGTPKRGWSTWINQLTYLPVMVA